MIIDARTQHDPAKAPGLVLQAIEVCGTQREVAARAGLSEEYLRLLLRGERRMSYAVQVVLEKIARID